MAKTSSTARCVSLILTGCLLASAPGFQASAAAAVIVRSQPGAPIVPTLATPLAAAAPSASLQAPLPLPSAVSAALPALPAASDAPKPESPVDAAKSAASPSDDASRADREKQVFDGAAASPADDAALDLPEPPLGRVRVSFTLTAVSDDAYQASLKQLRSYYGFEPERAVPAGRGLHAMRGLVHSSTVLAMDNAPGVSRLRVLDGAPDPAPEDSPRLAAVAEKLSKTAPTDAFEPFVPATRRVAELERLTRENPAQAYALATKYVTQRGERRVQVRLAALRALDALPLAKVLPFYRTILAEYSTSAVQEAKAAGSDSTWYIQRAVLQRFAREAPSLKGSAEDLALARTQHADRNGSVRVAAAAALRALGAEPGPENRYEPPAAPQAKRWLAPVAKDEPADEHAIDAAREAPPGKDPIQPKLSIGEAGWKGLRVVLLGLVLTFGAAALLHPEMLPWAHPTEKPTPAIVIQPAPAAQAAAVAPDEKNAHDDGITDHQLLESIALNEARAANAQERLADTQFAEYELQVRQSQSGWMSWAMEIGIAILSLMGMYWIFRKFSGGGVGRGGAASNFVSKNIFKAERPTTRFSDIEGVDEALVEARELVEYLRDPRSFQRIGARIPKGTLLEGPPGTGKTLLAKAIAGEAGVPFFAISASEFVEMFVGVGAARVRELFAEAAKHKPAIIFIDELDAMGKKRSADANGAHDEREQTLNQLLVEIEGANEAKSDGILVLGATNRADQLDPALVRPGRFGNKLYVGNPHKGGREAIAVIHSKDVRLAPDLDLGYVARRSMGLAGANIKEVMAQAALIARRRGADAVGAQDVDEALDKGTIGGARFLPMSESLKKRVAYHEAGHVLANRLNPDPEARQPVNKLTIVPHGSGALGFAETGSEDGDTYLHTRPELDGRIDTALGGLAAETIVFGKEQEIPAQYRPRADWSTGPGSDLEHATRLASSMVQELGMGESTGLAVTAAGRDPYGRSPFGDIVGAKVWKEVNGILAESRRAVTERLRLNRHVLEALAQAVLKKETLIDAEIDEIIEKAGPVYPTAAPSTPKN